YPGLLNIRAKSDADKSAISLAPALSFANRRNVNQLPAPSGSLGIITAVKDHSSNGGVRHLLRSNHVLGADHQRISINRACHLFDNPFDYKASARSSYSAIRAERRFVSNNGKGFHAPISDIVWAWQIAGRHAGVKKWPIWPEGISAGINGELRVDPDDFACLIGISRDTIKMIARLKCRKKILDPILNPAHGKIELEGQCCHD